MLAGALGYGNSDIADALDEIGDISIPTPFDINEVAPAEISDEELNIMPNNDSNRIIDIYEQSLDNSSVDLNE